jgi:NADH-quinone oxidoreductase subunit N
MATARCAPVEAAPFFLLDGHARYYTMLILLCGLAVALLARGDFGRTDASNGEYGIFVLLSVLGAVTLVASRHFASFFLGFELLSVPLYILIAFPESSARAAEAGVKYLVLGSMAAAFILLGMALIYAGTGSMEFPRTADSAGQGTPLYLDAGFSLILVGIGFKLALAPFHQWAPDIYQGAPPPSAALVATVSKVAVFGALMRLYFPVISQPGSRIAAALQLLAVLSMFIGNLLALFQNDLLRVIAYSSIAHMGYFMVAFLGNGPIGSIASTYYITAYAVSVIGVFASIASIAGRGNPCGDFSVADLTGLAKRKPVTAGLFTLSLLSLAGLPFTAGFMGKFYVVGAGMQGHVVALAVSLVVSSVIGLFCYLRIVSALYQESPPYDGSSVQSGQRQAATGLPVVLVLWSAPAIIVLLGILPGPLFSFIQQLITG